MFRTLFAALFPLFAERFILIRFIQENAVSADEKKADRIIKITIAASRIIRCVSNDLLLIDKLILYVFHLTEYDTKCTVKNQ